MSKSWRIKDQPDRATPAKDDAHVASLDLPAVLNGVKCVYCEGPCGMTYLHGRFGPVCSAKKCRFAYARELDPRNETA